MCPLTEILHLPQECLADLHLAGLLLFFGEINLIAAAIKLSALSHPIA